MKYIGSFHAQERNSWTDYRFFQFLFFSDRVFLLRSGDKVNMADQAIASLNIPGFSKPMMPGIPGTAGPRCLTDYTYARDSYEEIRAIGG